MEMRPRILHVSSEFLFQNITSHFVPHSPDFDSYDLQLILKLNHAMDKIRDETADRNPVWFVYDDWFCSGLIWGIPLGFKHPKKFTLSILKSSICFATRQLTCIIKYRLFKHFLMDHFSQLSFVFYIHFLHFFIIRFIPLSQRRRHFSNTYSFVPFNFYVGHFNTCVLCCYY